MIGGYLDDPEEAKKRALGRRVLIVSLVAAFATFAGFVYFRDAIVATLGLTESGYRGMRIFTTFLVLFAATRLVERKMSSMHRP